MIKNVVPKVAIRDSPQTDSPQTGPTAIMDDPVYTMDDDEVMMGGPVTIYPNIRARAVVPVIRVSIPKRH